MVLHRTSVYLKKIATENNKRKRTIYSLIVLKIRVGVSFIFTPSKNNLLGSRDIVVRPSAFDGFRECHISFVN